MRRALTILATLALCIGLSAPAATARTLETAPIDQPIAQTFGACTDEFGNNYHLGNSVDSGTSRIDAVHGKIDILKSTFGPCSSGEGPFTHDGAFAWIGLEPGAASGQLSGIYQVGIADCFDPYTSVCDGTPHAFVGTSGCGYPGVITDLGPISGYEHEFIIERRNTSNGYAYLTFIDGVNRFTRLIDGSSRLECWANGDTRAVWSGETWDGGDSLADASDKLNFRESWYGKGAPPVWYSPNWSYSGVGGCTRSEDSDQLDYKCDKLGPDYFVVWSEPL